MSWKQGHALSYLLELPVKKNMRWSKTDNNDSKIEPIREAITTALAYGDSRLGNTGMVEKALYGCMIDKSHVNNDNMIVANLEAAKICAAISSQPPIIRAWLRFCYGPNDNKHDHGEVAMGVMWINFADIGAKLWDKHVRFCEIATLDEKCRIIAGKPIPREIYYPAVKTIKQHWIRDGWARKLNLCAATLAGYDERGLQGVSGVVRSVCAR